MSCSDTLEPSEIGCQTGDRWLYMNNRRCEDKGFIVTRIFAFREYEPKKKKGKTGLEVDMNRTQWKFRSR